MRRNAVSSMKKKRNNCCPSSDCTFFSLKESEKNGINCFYLRNVCSAFGRVGSLCFTRVPESYYFDFLACDAYDERRTSPNEAGDMLFSPIFSRSSFTRGTFSNDPFHSFFKLQLFTSSSEFSLL